MIFSMECVYKSTFGLSFVGGLSSFGVSFIGGFTVSALEYACVSRTSNDAMFGLHDE